MTRKPLFAWLPSRFVLLLAPLIAAWPTRSYGANGDWTATVGGDWATATNWSSNPTVPGSAAGDVVNINSNIAANATITLGANRTVGTLLIGDADTTHSFALTGNALVLDQTASGTAMLRLGIAGSTANIANSIASTITLNDNARIFSSLTNNQTLSGVISGARSLTFDNDDGVTALAPASLQGQFVLSAANTYSTGTTIDDVRVWGQNSAAFGTGAVTINDGGQVFANTAVTFGNNFTITGNGWIETAAGQPFGAMRLDSGAIVSGGVTLAGNASIGSQTGTGTVSGVISGAGTLTKAGPATLVLSNLNNTYTGGTVVGNGTLQLNNNNAASTGTISFVPGGSSGTRLLLNGVTIQNNIAIGNTAGIAGQGVLQQTGSAPATVSGTINITGSPSAGGHLVGGGSEATALQLLGPITSSVQISQRSGFVGYAGGGTGYNSLLVTGTAYPLVTDGISTAANVNLGGSGQAILDLNGFNQSLAGLTFGTAGQAHQGIVNLGTGVLTLTGGVTTTGTTPSHQINVDLGGSLDTGGAMRTFNIGDSTSYDDLRLDGMVVTGSGITKTGPGTLSFDQTGIAGTLAVEGGSIAAGLAHAPGSFSVSTLAFGAGATSLRMKTGPGGDVIFAGTVTTAGTATVDIIQPGGIIMPGTYPLINYTGASPGLSGFALAPVGHAAASLIDTGTSIALKITGNDKVVWDGTNSTAWTTAATGNWKMQTGGAATDFIQSDEVIFPDGPVNSTVNIAASVQPSWVTFNNSTATSYTLTGAAGIVGPGGLIKSGNGTVLINNQNGYTGLTEVQGGVLDLDHDAPGNTVLVNTSGVSVSAGATLKLNANDFGFTFNRDISGGGTVEVNPHSASGGTASHTVTLSGNNNGFNGTLRLLSPVTGTYRIQPVAPGWVGDANIEVQNGAQILTGQNFTFNNNISITGNGYAESGTSGSIGALRLENNVTWAGDVVVSGSARIGAHAATATISGDISGGALSVNATNFNSSYNLIFTGNNSYGTTTIGGQNTQTAGVPTMRLNIGNGGTTGTLGAGNVIINGDGANGVLGFDRSNGYTLAAGQTITGAGSQPTRVFIDVDTLGTGFSDNGNTITLGTETAGGTVRIGQARQGAVASFSGALTAAQISPGSVTQSTTNFNAGAVIKSGTIQMARNAGANGSVLNINAGATVTTNFLSTSEAASAAGTVNQSGGTVTVTGQVRTGHFGTETSTYNMMGGSLNLSGASTTLSPSTSAAGGNGATGDNNIDALATATIHGGGIYVGIDGTGIFNHSGGTVSTNWIVMDNRADSGAGLNMPTGIDQYNLGGTGTLNLKSTWGVVQRNVSAEFNLGGGTIRVDNTGTGGAAGNTGANINVPLDTTLNVAGNSAVLDTNGAGNGFTLTRNVNGTGTVTATGGGNVVLNPSAGGGSGTQTISANIAGSNPIVKQGAGVTTFTGPQSYTGATTVSAGRLNLSSSMATSSITVADGAAIGAGEGAVIPSITFGNTTGGSLFFDPTTAGALTATNLTVNGTNLLELTAIPTTAGPWTALNYGTKSGSGSFAVANPGNFRVAPAVNDTGSAITLNITGTKTILWTGAASAVWDINNAVNWTDGAIPEKFFSGDAVVLPQGAANTTITLTGTMLPAALVANATSTNYTLTSSGVNQLSGAMGIQKTGGGTLTLAGANAHSGQTSIGGGTVSIGAATSLGNGAPTNNIALSGGGKLLMTAGMDLGVNRTFNVGTGGGALGGTGTITIPGAISGSGTLTFTSHAAAAPTYVLTGNNSGFTGNVNVDGATATGGMTTLRLATNNAITSGTINLAQASIAAGTGTTLDLANVTVSNAVTVQMNSNLAGNFRSAIIASNGNNVINGPIVMNGDGLNQFYANANAANTFTVNSAISTGGGGYTGRVYMRGAGTGIINGSINMPNAILDKTEASTWTVSSPSVNVAGFQVSDGTVRLGGNNIFPASVGLTIGQGSGTSGTLDLAGFNQTFSSITIAAGSTGTANRVINNGTAPSTLTVDQSAASVTYSGLLQNGTGVLSLTKNGTGNLVLSNAGSSFTGGVTVNGGTLTASSTSPAAGATASALGAVNSAGRTLTINSGGTLAFTNVHVLGNGIGNTNLPKTVVNAGGTVSSTRYNVLGDLELNGGTLTQTSTDTGGYEGFQFRGGVTASGTAASTITSTNGKANHLSPNTIFDVGNATGDSGVDLTVSAPLANSSIDFGLPGGLTKTGAGTMSLTTSNTYTGVTNVNQGTLLVAPGGSIAGSAAVIASGAALTVNGTAGAISVASGGILNGSGTVGALTLDGTIAPGNSPGLMNTGSVIASSSTVFNIEIGGYNPGTEFDRIATTGSISLDGTLSVSLISGFTPSMNDQFYFWLNDGIDPIAGSFAGLPNGAEFPAGNGGVWKLNTGANGDGGAIGNDISVTYVPEPGAAALTLGGALLIASRRRRRK